MRTITLSDGAISQLDNTTHTLQGMHTWRRNSSGYVIRSEYQAIGTPRTIYLHRLVAGVTDPKVQVRHLDGDKLNNQKHNLEVAR